MSVQFPRLLPLLVSAPPLAGTLLYLYLRNSCAQNALFSPDVPEAHLKSYSISIANPRGVMPEHDSVTMSIPLSKLPPGITDEEILARFSRGFFGGWAFWAERMLFASTGISMTHFTGIALNKQDHEASSLTIWSPRAMSNLRAPALRTLLFGNFLVLDSSSASLAERSKRLPASASFPRPTGSFVDFGFGSDASTFAGSNRFSVHRSSEAAEDGSGEAVVVKFSQVRCNPQKDAPLLPSWFIYLHSIYARVLFADGIRYVLAA